MASRFWVGGTGNWSDTTHWAATTGGAGGQTVPGTSDDVFLDGSSGVGTITLDSATQNCKGFDCTGYTGTLDLNAKQLISGNTTTTAMVFKLVSGMTLSNTGGGSGVGQIFISPAAGGTTALTSGTKSIPNLTCQNAGVVTLQDALTVAFNLQLTGGTLDTNSKAVSCSTFGSSNSNTRTLTLGSSIFTCTLVSGAAYAWDMSTTTNLTFNAGTSTVVFNGTGNVVISPGAGAVSFYNLQRVVATPGGSDFLQIASDLVVSNIFTATGSDAGLHRGLIGGVNTLNINAIGTARTITAASVSLTNIDFQDITAAGAAAPFSGTSIGNALGNTNITFTAPVTRYAVVAGNWSSTAMWATTSGGAGGASVPICHDTVFMDANSAAGTYQVDCFRPAANFDCTGFTRTLQLNSTTQWYGNFTLGSGMTITNTATVGWFGRGNQTITCNGKSFSSVIQVNAPSGIYTLQDNLTTTGTSFRHVNGIWRLNGKTISAQAFLSIVGPVATTPVLDLQGGTVNLTGTGTVWTVSVNCTVFGGGSINITDTTSTAKTFAPGNGSVIGSTLKHIVTGSAGLTISGNSTFDGIDLECTTARTITLGAGGTTRVNGPLTLKGASGQLLSLVSSTPGTAVTIKYYRSLKTEAFDSLSGDVTLTAINPPATMLLGAR